MNDKTSSWETYVAYVEEVIARYKKIGDLAGADDTDLDPSSINWALANYYSTASGLIAEYQRAKSAYLKIKRAFERWWDPVFLEAKRAVIRDYVDVKGVKPSVSEFESRARVDHVDEYADWIEKMDAAEAQVAFLQRLVNLMESYDHILVALSTNSRSDMYHLSIDRRAVKESSGQGVTRRIRG